MLFSSSLDFNVFFLTHGNSPDCFEFECSSSSSSIPSSAAFGSESIGMEKEQKQNKTKKSLHLSSTSSRYYCATNQSTHRHLRT